MQWTARCRRHGRSQETGERSTRAWVTLTLISCRHSHFAAVLTLSALFMSNCVSSSSQLNVCGVSDRFNLLYSTRSAELIIAEVGEAELWQLLRETDHTHKVVAAVIRTVGASMAEEEGSPEEYSEPIEVTCKQPLPTTVLLYCCPDFTCASVPSLLAETVARIHSKDQTGYAITLPSVRCSSFTAS